MGNQRVRKVKTLKENISRIWETKFGWLVSLGKICKPQGLEREKPLVIIGAGNWFSSWGEFRDNLFKAV